MELQMPATNKSVDHYLIIIIIIYYFTMHLYNVIKEKAYLHVQHWRFTGNQCQ